MEDKNIKNVNINNIKEVDVIEEMKSSYINYAMSVITARALPDARDGLKPVQRRIIYTMHEDNLHHTAKYSKSARTVGDVMGKYHPHGDMSIYDALVHMAQDFSIRYQLIDGQGNFGSIDGDSPAAMRYTEAKLAKISDEIIKDIEKETVNFQDSYDGRLKEPVVLPSAIPNLLLNGADGIAVGMATKIPPHNIEEVLSAIIFILDQIKSITPEGNIYSEVTTAQLMEYIKGPDFPTKGVIYDRQEIENLYSTGRGRIVIRGKANIEENKASKMQIIISEIPFQVNKSRFIEKIASLVKDQKLEGISDIRDESAKDEIRVVLDLKREAKPNILVNKLFKYTELQSVFNANMLAITKGEPKLLTLKNILDIFIEHRIEVIERRTRFELEKAKARAHILEGLKIAIDHIDAVIKIIRESKDSDVAKTSLMKSFSLTEIQAVAILDMQLRRLAALERNKIEEELAELRKLIKSLETILSDKFNVIKIIKEETQGIMLKYPSKRLTKVVKSKVGEFEIEDIVERKEVLITISKQGYIKRLSPDTYRVQHRGGKGVIGMTTKETDSITHALVASTTDNILFFSNKGRVFVTKVFEIPEFSRVAKGQPLINIINIDQGEQITSVITTKEIGEESESIKYLFMVTKNGTVKKTLLDKFKNIRKNGIIAITIDKDDELKWVMGTKDNDEILIATKKAHSIRFSEKDVRETGRSSRGVKGISINKVNDEVVGAGIVQENSYVVVVSQNGYGKRTKIEEHLTQGRGGKGAFIARINPKTGDLVSMKIVQNSNEELLIISNKGQIIKIPLSSISLHSRHTSGSRLINLSGDFVSTTEINKKIE